MLVGSVLCPSGWGLLGDLTKFATMSTDLFSVVECTAVGLRIEMDSFVGTVPVTVAAGPRVLVLQARGGEVFDLGK
jgi:hypothetical protein